MNDVGQTGGPDELVAIQLPSGAASHLYFFPQGLNLLESLAYDERENVLWTTNDGVLYRIEFQINTQSFHVVRIGDTGKSDIDGLTVQPLQPDGGGGHLFGITHGGNDLLLIDKVDAGTSVINGNVEVGSRLEDLAFDSAGRLFILTSRALIEVDPTDGARLLKANLNGASSLEGLIWWKERGVFLSAADRGHSKDLVTVDLAGNVTFLSAHSSGFGDIEALAFVPTEAGEVPITLLAEGITRNAAGVALAWRAPEPVAVFVVQRSLHALGPWDIIGELRLPLIGGAASELYRFHDAEAALAWYDVDLFYRVGAQDELGDWSWVTFNLAAAPPPQTSLLHENAPNPFNPRTTFRVQLAQPQTVSLRVFDIRGRLVHQQTMRLGIGSHGIEWDGHDPQGLPLASGIYPYVLHAGQQYLRARAVLMK
jgi:hypothetical protein